MPDTQTPPSAPNSSGTMPVMRLTACLAAPLLAVAVYLLLPSDSAELTSAGRATAAIGTLMAVLWMTEALPLPATALLPVVLFPLTAVSDIQSAAAPYANRFIFLFMGGFMLALAIERWNLHRRIALRTVLLVGTSPRQMVGGFMLATALLSMWISNTATTVLMLPIASSVIALLAERVDDTAAGEHAGKSSNFAISLLLGIAYAASIGGVGTLVGTPPNVFMAGFLSKEYGITLGFAQWMGLALPLVVVMLMLTWLGLTRVVFPIQMESISGGRQLIRDELEKLGRMSRGERVVLIVFAVTATAWVVRGPLTKWTWLVERLPVIGRLDDTIIALLAALTLFAWPVDARRGVFALDWKTARRLPWGMLLLFGGGLSLASAVSASGLDGWIGELVRQRGDRLSPVALVVLVTAVVIFLTELTSNIATASAFLPILGGVALGLELEPMLLVVPAALAASCAFMLPVATPPNAIVFGSGQIQIGQMIKAGLWLNLAGVVLIPLTIYMLGGWLLGIRLSSL